MKSTPTLFQRAMVNAMLREVDPKTITRRPVKGEALDWLEAHNFTPELVALPENTLCPYGYAGDQIWVRETFFAWGRWETRFSAKKGRDEWHFVDMTLETGHAYCYVADGVQPALLAGKRDGGVTPKWWKRPAIFMPRAASRITLELTGVRVERLQDISEADAIAEGCGLGDYIDMPGPVSFKRGYHILWESINGQGSWDLNPYVWVIEFNVKGAQ
jgi:hypothetical protein